MANNNCDGVDDRWVFEVPYEAPHEEALRRGHRGRAWGRCVRAGLLVGIPQHAWRKRHDFNEYPKPGSFRWVTATYADIDEQTEVIAKRRRTT